MATDLETRMAQDPLNRPVEMNGIRWSTFEAILADIGDQRTGLAYDAGWLRFKTSVLYHISWSTFEAILEDLGEHRGIRLSYDQGRLEFMSPSRSHDLRKTLIGRMIELFTLALGIRISSGGSLTLRRGDFEKGVEPDECYWIAHEPEVRGKKTLDFATDPVPDLAVEVDETHDSRPSLAIYAALRVPEVWRLVKGSLLIHHLQADGTYATRPDSPSLPGLTAVDIERFLRRGGEIDETSLMSEFLDWVRVEIPRRRDHPAPGAGA